MPKQKLRFAISGHRNGDWCSDRWTAMQRGADFFLVASGLGSAVKISLHASGICRFALTDTLASHSPPLFEEDRVIHKWESSGFSGVQHTHMLTMHFLMVGEGRSRKAYDSKKTTLLPRAPSGFSTEVAVFLSDTNPMDWKDNHFIPDNIFGLWSLPGRGFLALRRRVSGFDGPRFQSLLASTAGKPFISVGEEDPGVMGKGYCSALLSEATPHFAEFFVIDPVNIGAIEGARADWSTKTGNKFKKQNS